MYRATYDLTMPEDKKDAGVLQDNKPLLIPADEDEEPVERRLLMATTFEEAVEKAKQLIPMMRHGMVYQNLAIRDVRLLYTSVLDQETV
jgi:hypothetical protein